MLRRHMVDHHHYQLYAPFACPDNSHTSLGPPAHYYMWKHLYPIFGTSHVNRLCSTHVYLFSIPEYSHAWSRYHMFIFPCHMFVLFFHTFILLSHMPLPIIPHARCPSLPIMFQFFLYISIKYLSSVSNIKSSSPLLSHFVSEVYSLHLKSRAHRWRVAQHIHWGLALIC